MITRTDPVIPFSSSVIIVFLSTFDNPFTFLTTTFTHYNALRIGSGDGSLTHFWIYLRCILFFSFQFANVSTKIQIIHDNSKQKIVIFHLDQQKPS